MQNFAFFFPGQGSQSVGMMAGFEGLAVIQETFQQASDTLKTDFWGMVTEPNELLNQTQHTQPLMLTAGVATWRAYQQLGGTAPSVLATTGWSPRNALMNARLCGPNSAVLYGCVRLYRS